MDQHENLPRIVVKQPPQAMTHRGDAVDNFGRVSFVLACCAMGFLVPGAWGFFQTMMEWLYRPGWGSVLLVLPAIPISMAGIGAGTCSRTSKWLAILNVAPLIAAIAYMVWVDSLISGRLS